MQTLLEPASEKVIPGFNASTSYHSLPSVISFDRLLRAMAENELMPWYQQFHDRITEVSDRGHGDLFRWQQILQQLPDCEPSIIDLSASSPIIGAVDDLDASRREVLRNLLLQLHPWRKGPFELFGIHIDSEWRSNLKWQRLAEHIAPLEDRLVLDVGGGNGYYALRMIGAGARFVLSIDPSWLFVIQFLAIANYLPGTPAYVAPMAMENLPPNMQVFDTVFSMGVLYHRRSPLQHLQELRSALRPGGQLILETLVVEDDRPQVLVPADRYAKMRNVWFIASLPTLQRWLAKSGFENVDIIGESVTTTEEQRRTEWMRFESLADYLDPSDASKTIEGYPAPRRAILTAQKPE
jgi:tRNA (mo5U34)-methyltransferase